MREGHREGREREREKLHGCVGHQKDAYGNFGEWRDVLLILAMIDPWVALRNSSGEFLLVATSLVISIILEAKQMRRKTP